MTSWISPVLSRAMWPTSVPWKCARDGLIVVIVRRVLDHGDVAEDLTAVLLVLRSAADERLQLRAA
jgi:hypothetical protein